MKSTDTELVKLKNRIVKIEQTLEDKEKNTPTIGEVLAMSVVLLCVGLAFMLAWYISA